MQGSQMKQIEFMMDEEKKVTIRSNNDSFPLYLLGMIEKNPLYKEGKSLIDLITDALSLFVQGDKLRPTLNSPTFVYIRVHGREKGIEEHTLFAFYQYPLSKRISIALLDGCLQELPQNIIEEIQLGGKR